MEGCSAYNPANASTSQCLCLTPRVLQNGPHPEYSITQLRAEVGELPVDGYVSVDITVTEAVEERTAWP